MFLYDFLCNSELQKNFKIIVNYLKISHILKSDFKKLPIKNMLL